QHVAAGDADEDPAATRLAALDQDGRRGGGGRPRRPLGGGRSTRRGRGAAVQRREQGQAADDQKCEKPENRQAYEQHPGDSHRIRPVASCSPRLGAAHPSHVQPEAAPPPGAPLTNSYEGIDATRATLSTLWAREAGILAERGTPRAGAPTRAPRIVPAHLP